MIVVEPVPVHRTAVLTRGNFRADDDAVIPAFRRLVDAARAAAPDVVLIQQLYHVGQHGDADNSFAPNWSASGLPSYHDADGGHAMTSAEIDEVIDGFVAAAERAKAAGFDGIEIFAAYHAFVDQFWTPWSNRRTDEWGGSFENRMRLSSTILSRIRERCGESFIVGLAVSVDEGSPATLSVEELQQVVAWHDERRLMDYVTCGTGSYLDFDVIIPPSLYPQRLGEPYAAALKSRRSPCAGAGGEPHPDARRGRGRARRRVGRSREHRPGPDRRSVSRRQGTRRPGRRGPAVHLVQPAVLGSTVARLLDLMSREPVGRARGRVGRRAVRDRRDARDVLIVGGGPAGLETARVAAVRGHRVTLVERSDRLGGQFRLAGLQPSRGQIGDLLAWFERELARLGVEVRLGEEVDAEAVARFGADVVVVATGARPARAGFQRAVPMVDRLPGVDAANVFAIHDVLDGTTNVGRRVLVLDDLGDWRGTGTAVALAESGHEVTVVTSAAVIAGGLAHSAVDGPLRRRFAAAGGTARPSTAIDAWSGEATPPIDPRWLDERTGRRRPRHRRDSGLREDAPRRSTARTASRSRRSVMPSRRAAPVSRSSRRASWLVGYDARRRTIAREETTMTIEEAEHAGPARRGRTARQAARLEPM